RPGLAIRRLAPLRPHRPSDAAFPMRCSRHFHPLRTARLALQVSRAKEGLLRSRESPRPFIFQESPLGLVRKGLPAPVNHLKCSSHAPFCTFVANEFRVQRVRLGSNAY